MRYVQASVMVLGTVLYLVFWSLMSTEFGGTEPFRVASLWMVIGWNTVLLVVTVLVIVDGVRKIRARKTWELATGVFMVKLAAIPFFVLNCLVLTGFYLVGGMLLLFGGPLIQAAVFVGVGLTYLAMLSTSVYGWAGIIQLRRERRIDTPLVVLYSILLFIFVTDTLAAILLFADARRTRRAIRTSGTEIEHDVIEVLKDQGEIKSLDLDSEVPA